MGQWIEIVLGFILWPFIAYFLGREASRKNRIVYYIYAAAMFLYTVVLACIDIQGWWLDFLRNGALSFTLVVLIRFAYQGGKTESKLLVGWGFSTFMLCVLFFCVDPNSLPFLIISPPSTSPSRCLCFRL